MHPLRLPLRGGRVDLLLQRRRLLITPRDSLLRRRRCGAAQAADLRQTPRLVQVPGQTAAFGLQAIHQPEVPPD